MSTPAQNPPNASRPADNVMIYESVHDSKTGKWFTNRGLLSFDQIVHIQANSPDRLLRAPHPINPNAHHSTFFRNKVCPVDHTNDNAMIWRFVTSGTIPDPGYSVEHDGPNMQKYVWYILVEKLNVLLDMESEMSGDRAGLLRDVQDMNYEGGRLKVLLWAKGEFVKTLRFRDTLAWCLRLLLRFDPDREMTLIEMLMLISETHGRVAAMWDKKQREQQEKARMEAAPALEAGPQRAVAQPAPIAHQPRHLPVKGTFTDPPAPTAPPSSRKAKGKQPAEQNAPSFSARLEQAREARRQAEHAEHARLREEEEERFFWQLERGLSAAEVLREEEEVRRAREGQ